ncbi:Cx9C motif-containing protein 4 [Labeo rohita]|uniref:Cx9C motif-containing protein 4 n=1 Tax=Labeo rohita TaxID=84645 RepID=A0ABQ8LK05_LABRO|nr:Cx9C motif-containing protein 4 [Labeo rohita]
MTSLFMRLQEVTFNWNYSSKVRLGSNKYIESLCEDVIQAMRKCCEVHAKENSVCCSGFAKEHKATDTKTVV